MQLYVYHRCHFILKDETSTFNSSSHERCKMLKRSKIYFKMLKKQKQNTEVYLLGLPKTDKQGDEKDRLARKISKHNSYSSNKNTLKL